MSCPVDLAPDGVLTPAQFRELIPGFNDSSKYSDFSLSTYLQMAATSLDPHRWGQWYIMGMALWSAHFLSLDARENAVALKGGIPGQASIGILSSKSIGGVSAGYDVSSANEKDAGMWNLTSYGKRYIHFARLAGMGGVQITGGFTNQRNANDPGGLLF